MQGERTVAVGLSLTLHACVAGLVIARLAVVPSLMPGPSISVSFDAPPAIVESAAAALRQEVPPSAEVGGLPAVAPASLPPVASMPAISAAPAASSLTDKGAGLDVRPMPVAPSSQVSDHASPDLRASPSSAEQAMASMPPVASADLLAGEDQVGSSATAADALPIGPLASGTMMPGTVPTLQAVSEAPTAVLDSETAPPSQAAAVSAAPDLKRASSETLGALAVVPEFPPAAPPPQVLLNAPPPALPPAVPAATPMAAAALASPAPPDAFPPAVTAAPIPQAAHDVVPAESLPERHNPDASPPAAIAAAVPAAEATLTGPASVLPLVEAPKSQPAPDVVQAESLPARQGTDVLAAPVAVTGTPRETVMASLAPMPPSKALDLTATDTPAPPTDADRAGQIRAFVDRYDGGPCFFATVRRVSASSADIESFSTASDTFRQFDHALKTSTGVEPTVSGQRIWSAQCPAIDYLRKLPHEAQATPTLDLERLDLDRGDALSGSVQGPVGRPLRLFVISETGAVTDVSNALSEHDGRPAFSFRPPASGLGGPFPQILVLVAGADRLPQHPVSVDDLFKPLIAAKGIGYSIAAKMFLVTR